MILIQDYYEDSDEPPLFSRLDERWRQYFLDNSFYTKGIARPLRHNQKITDGELIDYFNRLDGEYIQIDQLKLMFGPTPERPDGLIKVNNTDTTTTVISSSYLRRLSRITSASGHKV